MSCIVWSVSILYSSSIVIAPRMLSRSFVPSSMPNIAVLSTSRMFSKVRCAFSACDAMLRLTWFCSCTWMLISCLINVTFRFASSIFSFRPFTMLESLCFSASWRVRSTCNCRFCLISSSFDFRSLKAWTVWRCFSSYRSSFCFMIAFNSAASLLNLSNFSIY